MEKIFLYESTYGKLRYSLVNNEVWFLVCDVVKALNLDNTVVGLYIKEDDKKSISFMSTAGVVDTKVAVNLYGIFQLISFTSMNSESNAMGFKNVVLKNIIPNLVKVDDAPKLSKEDEAILEIVHAGTNLEKAYGISKFKTAMITNMKESKVVKKVDRRRKEPNNTPVFKIANVNDDLNLKKGQITKWFIDNGMFCYGGASGKSPQIKESGSSYLRFFNDGNSKRMIGLTEAGLNYIKDNIDDVRSVKLRD